MKFLANENVPQASIESLRESGFDVTSISKESPGISDREVLKRATADNRTIITFDSDYGELVFFEGVPCPPSILYLRFQPMNPLEPAERIRSLLAADDEVLLGFFVVLDEDAVRRRPLPNRDN